MPSKVEDNIKLGNQDYFSGFYACTEINCSVWASVSVCLCEGIVYVGRQVASKLRCWHLKTRDNCVRSE